MKPKTKIYLRWALQLSFLFLTLIHFLSCESNFQFEVPDNEGMRWFKGNTHAHTTNSDGDSPPEYVAQWYKDHGYQFLVLSDHNFFTDPAAFVSLVDSSFLLIAGEEVTSEFEKKPVHVNGLNLPGLVEPQSDSTLVGTIQKNVDAIRAVEGAPHINHPNFRWAFHQRELSQVQNYNLLEIYNGHPMVHNFGGGEWPGMEQVWDHLLSAGQKVYGIAVDDAHNFQTEFSKDDSNPGRGWVVVKANSLDASEIIANLEKGWFYASTGVVLEEIKIQPKALEIRIFEDGDFKYQTEFIGEGGEILARSAENPAIFELRRREKYVRAKIMDSGGSVAWVQPVFVR